MKSIVSTILCCTIDDFRRQMRGFKDIDTIDARTRAIQFTFRLKVDPAKEIGYRYLTLTAWAPTNYVGIFTNEVWDICSKSDLASATDPKTVLDKAVGTTGYELHTYHDSCWRDGVRRVLSVREDAIDDLRYMSTFYEVVSVDQELENKFRQLISDRRNR